LGPKLLIFAAFRLLRNLLANVTAIIFGMKHDIDKRGRALETTRVSYSAQNFRNIGPQRA